MRKLFFIYILALLAWQANAQSWIGIFGGLSNYQGDLTDKAYQGTKGAFGITYSHDMTRHLTLRFGLTFAKVAGADSLSNKPDLRLRNLSFQSPITEFSVVGEYNTFDLDTKTWTPYLFAGLGVYHFNPFTYDRVGNKVYLKPLSTEGEGLAGYPDSKPYSLTQLAIPVGAGVKYDISGNVRIALEVGLRKLFTDHLDDLSGNYPDPADLLAAKGQEAVDLSYRGDEVQGGNSFFPAKGAQRGSTKYKDYYYFTGIHLSFSLPEGKGGGYTGRDKKKGYGCPANPL